MRVTPEEYKGLDLRAHSLLAGVPLHDVWTVDLSGRRPGRTIVDLRALLSIKDLCSANSAVNFLFRLRGWLGRAFRWDHEPPKASEESFLHRLSGADRERSLVAPGTREGPFRVERASGYRLYWAIYVQPVGRLTSWYMRLIDPFRRVTIYPALLRYIRPAWSRREAAA